MSSLLTMCLILSDVLDADSGQPPHNSERTPFPASLDSRVQRGTCSGQWNRKAARKVQGLTVRQSGSGSFRAMIQLQARKELILARNWIGPDPQKSKDECIERDSCC
jgi:hypothetical protein